MKIVLCGSSSAKEQKVKLKKELEKIGHQPIIHPYYEKLVAGEMTNLAELMEQEHYTAKRKHGFIKWYYDRILESDAILVVNIDKGDKKNYIGGNTLMEIGFAHVNDKKVFLLNALPAGLSYDDEIKAMYDEILDGDISKIPLAVNSDKKNLNMSEIATQAEKIEKDIGLTFDDILNKLTQEMGEFNDAVQKYRGRFCKKKSEDNLHIKEELGDVMLNIISICNKVAIDPNQLDKFANNTLEKFKERIELYKGAQK